MEETGSMRRGFPSSLCEQLFQQYSPLLKSVCKEYWRKYYPRIDSYEDLYQSVCYLFMYAYHIWQPEKGPFGSHLKRVLNFKLKAMLKGEYAPWHGDRPFNFLKYRKSEEERYETILLDEDFFDTYVCE
ncbi:MAG: sigma factor [Pseudothermotoga sp.]